MAAAPVLPTTPPDLPTTPTSPTTPTPPTPPTLSQTLSRDALHRAETFLADQARPLEQVTWTWAKGEGPTEAVHAALSAFRHPDGGFGHALEPDIQAAGSSVYATTVALQALRDLGGDASDPLVNGALRYLAAHNDRRQRAWPMVPADLDSAPHAPWWEVEDDLSGRMVNPRAEIVAHFLHWSGPGTGDGAPDDDASPDVDAIRPLLDDLPSLLAEVLDDLDARSEDLEQHELLCALRLLSTPALSPSDHARLESSLRPAVDRLVGRSGEAWAEYGLQPVWVAESPDAPFADMLADAIEANLGWLIETQGEDGSWSPAWDWSFVDADAWARAKRAWQGILTVRNLRALREFGRLAG